MKSIERVNISDPNAKSSIIHFAQKYNNYLFTIQDDDLLTIWNIGDSFKFIEISKVSLGGKFYEPNFSAGKV